MQTRWTAPLSQWSLEGSFVMNNPTVSDVRALNPRRRADNGPCEATTTTAQHASRLYGDGVR